MTSNRPYLIRAFHEWIVDNDMTPQIIVDASIDGVEVPRDYVQNDKITLNISAGAIEGLELGNDFVSFSARFSGRHFSVLLPVGAVIGIFALESGVGIPFEAVTHGDEDPPPEPPDNGGEKQQKPSLRVVK